MENSLDRARRRQIELAINPPGRWVEAPARLSLEPGSVPEGWQPSEDSMIDEEQHMAAIWLLAAEKANPGSTLIVDEACLELITPRGGPYIEATPKKVERAENLTAQLAQALAVWMDTPSMVSDYIQMERDPS